MRFAYCALRQAAKEDSWSRESPMNCSRCQGRMEEGFIPDSQLGPEIWVPGPPVSFWKRFMAYKNSIPIKTYRCTKCGHLESFAEKT